MRHDSSALLGGGALSSLNGASDMLSDVGAANLPAWRRRVGCCVAVSPWVSALSCMLVAVGLAVWRVFTLRASALTQEASAALLGGGGPEVAAAQQPFLVQELAVVVNWATLVGLVVIAPWLGLTALAALLRTYQAAARLPSTRCGAPGRLSYGAYLTLVAALNAGWWLIAVAVALMLAGSLVWLTVALLFSGALGSAVRPVPTGTMSPASYYALARRAVDGVPFYSRSVAPLLPDALAADAAVAAMDADAAAFAAQIGLARVTVCPESCFDVGSFYGALRLADSCLCGSDVAGATAAAGELWKALVHVLAALALMGVGCLWLLMHLSAEFAHARRDVRELQQLHHLLALPTQAAVYSLGGGSGGGGGGGGSAGGDAFATLTMAPYATSSSAALAKKFAGAGGGGGGGAMAMKPSALLPVASPRAGGGGAGAGDADCGASDTLRSPYAAAAGGQPSAFAAASEPMAAFAGNGGGGGGGGAFDSPIPLDGEAVAVVGLDGNAAVAGGGAAALMAPYNLSYNAPYEPYGDGDAAAGGLAAADDHHTNTATQASPPGNGGGSHHSRNASFNTTAQRYAAYRLRAQAAAKGSPASERQWRR